MRACFELPATSVLVTVPPCRLGVYCMGALGFQFVCVHSMQGQLRATDAIAAARLEENVQIQQWGHVEGGHDIDIADINVRMAAPALFLQHLRR